MPTPQPFADSGRGRIRSPCVGICELDGDHCRGCWRTLEEVAGWLAYSDAQRDAIISDLAAREAAATAGASERRPP